MLKVNMKQMSKISVDQDNVRFYDNIMKNKGSVISLDYQPYEDMLNEFGVFYTLTR